MVYLLMPSSPAASGTLTTDTSWRSLPTVPGSGGGEPGMPRETRRVLTLVLVHGSPVAVRRRCLARIIAIVLSSWRPASRRTRSMVSSLVVRGWLAFLFIALGSAAG